MISPQDDNDLGTRRSRFDDDEEEVVLSTGWSPRAITARVKKWIIDHKSTSFFISSISLGLGTLFLIGWTFLLTLELRRPTLEMAITAFHQGAYDEARRFSQSVLHYSQKNDVLKRSMANFIIGISLCRQTDLANIDEKDKTSLYLHAANALAESHKMGFPVNREAEGLFYLGKTLFLAQKYENAISPLQEALTLGFPEKRIIHWYLANAYFLSPRPDYQAALENINIFLSIPPFLEKDYQEAILLRAQIHLHLKNIDEAIQDYKTIPANTPFVAMKELVYGQILMAQAIAAFRRADILEENPQLDLSEEDLKLLQEERKSSRRKYEVPLEHQEAVPKNQEATPEPQEIVPENKEETPPQPRQDTAIHQDTVTIKKVAYQTDPPVIYQTDSPVTYQADFPLLAPTIGPFALEETENFSKNDAIQFWRNLGTQKYREAIERFRKVIGLGIEQPEHYRLALFLTGISYENLGEIDRAKETYYSVIRIFPGSSEAIAAAFRWSYLEYIHGNEQAGLDALARALDDLKRNPDYFNPWMSVTDIIELAKSTIQDLITQKDFPRAERLLGYFHELIPQKDQSRVYALLYERWVRALQAQMESADPNDKERLTREIEAKYRQAGKWYDELARWTFTTSEYQDNLWAAAEHYRQGRDFLHSILLYRQYLEANIFSNQPLAHYYIGRMLFDLDFIDEAIKEFKFCLENYPNAPIIEQVRLAAGYAYLEKKEPQLALDLLQSNLDGVVSPSAAVYRDSYFLMGQTLFGEKRYSEAIMALEEATRLYPDAEQVPESYYNIARALLSEIDMLKKEAQTSQLEQVRQQIQQTRLQKQESAFSYLQKAQNLLLQKEGPFNTPEKERRLRRNIALALGSLLIDMGPDHYDEAEQENRRTIAQFQDQPSVLQAYVQLIRVLSLMNRPEEAAKIRKQALYLLEQFRANKAFQKESVYSESDWETMLR